MIMMNKKQIKLTRSVIKRTIEESLPAVGDFKHYKKYQAMNDKKTKRFAGFLHSEVLFREMTESRKVMSKIYFNNGDYDIDNFVDINKKLILDVDQDVGTFKTESRRSGVEARFISMKYVVPYDIDKKAHTLTEQSLKDKIKQYKNKYKPQGKML